MTERLFTLAIDRACERYNIGRTQLYRLLNEGAIAAVKFGRRTLINVASADAYFSDLPVYTGELPSLDAAHKSRRSREHPRSDMRVPCTDQLRKDQRGVEQCHQDAI
jgi:excisionase family DNA binding protein